MDWDCLFLWLPLQFVVVVNLCFLLNTWCRYRDVDDSEIFVSLKVFIIDTTSRRLSQSKFFNEINQRNYIDQVQIDCILVVRKTSGRDSFNKINVKELR